MQTRQSAARTSINPPVTDRGAVTVEAAIALSALTLVFALLLAGTVTMTDQLRCADAAREAARLISRGEPRLAEEAVARIAPQGAQLSVNTEGDNVMVQVRANAVAGLLPGVNLVAVVHTVLEPGVSHANG
ncbi:TadE family type IV pilus minor pilin [Amycolatopsis taiwanensis]|uniref:Pilus assembly protein TadE n=1 Tax=Amycolatopsis taiwanensis TaxID=342230 RepID=A0A9W6R499_9PSEU|nr:TadE family type IV pilus minor pilin [Amycolatopsis taiwanensis]GLY68611.1 hypothetical protein Atai01_52300 [Amycolatopsis taiwanensis]